LKLNDGRFHHFAIVKDGNSYFEYIDGNLISQDTGPAFGTQTSAPVEIGLTSTGICTPEINQLNGVVDEIEIYHRALSADEVLAIFNAGSAGKCKEIASACEVTYTPEPNVSGSDRFSFTVSDGRFASDPATVAIDLSAVNDPPVITSTAGLQAVEGVSYRYDVQALDPDALDKLTYSLPTAPANMKIDFETGLITWTPTDAQLGDNDVTVRVDDTGGLFATQSFTITVDPLQNPPTNDPPTALPQAAATIEETPVETVLSGIDIDGDPLTIEITSFPDHGSLGPIIDCVSPAGLVGWWTGDGHARDIAGTNSGILHNGVTFVRGRVEQAFSFAGSLDHVSIPNHPNIDFTSTDDYTIDFWMKTLPHNNAHPALVEKWIGFGIPYPYIVRLNTGAFGPAGTILAAAYDGTSNPAIVSSSRVDDSDWHHVAAVFRHSQNTIELYIDGQIESSLIYSVLGNTANGLPVFLGIRGSLDPSLEYNGLLDEVEIFSRALSAEEILAIFEAGGAGKCKGITTSAAVTYTPNTDFTGSDRFTFTVSDTEFTSAPATVSIDVAPVNDVPAITSVPIVTATQDQLYLYQVEVSNPDEGDTLQFSLLSFPLGMNIDAITGRLEWTPDASQLGRHPVTVKIEDSVGASAEQSFSLTVHRKNNAPAITSLAVTTATQGQLYSYDVAATDPDLAVGDHLVFSLDLHPPGMIVDDQTGTIQWTPDAVQVGTHAVAVGVTDTGGLFATQSFTVTVANVDDPPQFTSSPLTAGTQEVLFAYAIQITDPDPGDQIRFIIEKIPGGMGFDPQTRQLLWTPAAQQVGFNQVRLRAEDATGLFDVQDFTINVANVNDPPTITSTPADTTVQGEPYTYQPVVDDLDLGIDENLMFSFDGTVPPTGMTIDPTTGLVEWTPTDAHLGDNAVTVKVTDQGGFTDEQSFSVNVLPPNDAPVADAGPDQTAEAGDTVLLNGSGSYDIDGDRLTFAWTLRTRPSESQATLAAAATVRPTLEVDEAGIYEVELVVDDGRETSAPDSVLISTGNVSPVAHTGPDQTAAVGETVSLDGSGSSDVNGDPLTFVWMLIASPTGSAATLSDEGAVRPSFVVDEPGTYEVALIVNDGTEDSAEDVVTVSTINSRPVADAGPDLTATVGQTVSLDGNGSGDIDGDPFTQRWSFTTVPSGSTATLSDANALAPQFVVDLPGIYVAQLIVDDGQDISRPDTVMINTERGPPMADAGPDQAVHVDAAVILDGSASSDPDNDPLNARWNLTVLPAGSAAILSDPSTISPSFVADAEGLYVAQLIVNDSDEDSAPDTVAITAAFPMTAVPPVEGLIQADAEEDILAANLSVGTIRPANSSNIPKGTVISQSPAAGATVAELSTIDLVVSIGTDPAVLASIAVTPADSTLAKGLTRQFTAVGTFSDGSAQDLTEEVVWESTNTKVVVIGPTGLARTLSMGMTTIRATRDGLTGSTNLTIVGATLVSIEVTPTATLILTNETQPFTALGVLTDGTRADLDGQLTWVSSVPAVASISTSGETTGVAAGDTTISATRDGITGSATLSVEARVAGDTVPPTVSITSPVSDSVIISPMDIIGTVNDANFLSYELGLARVGDATFSPFAFNTTPVVNGVLGLLDTTLLENGMYRVRLTAKDKNGHTAFTEIVVRTDGQAKVGIFTLSFVDLQIPVAGIPITVTRTYDSRVKTQRDFGVGWTLGISQGTYQNNRIPGEGWQILPGAPPHSGCRARSPTRRCRTSPKSGFRTRSLTSSERPSPSTVAPSMAVLPMLALSMLTAPGRARRSKFWATRRCFTKTAAIRCYMPIPS